MLKRQANGVIIRLLLSILFINKRFYNVVFMPNNIFFYECLYKDFLIKQTNEGNK